MANNASLRSERLATLFLLNLLAALAIPAVFDVFAGPWDHIISFVIAYLVLGLVDHRYLRTVFWGVVFLLYLIWQIILSSISIAWLVIQPRPKLDPGFVGVPLRLTSDLEITMLASSITLTPGTLSVDLGTDKDGGTILFVHNLRVLDPEAYRASVHNGFERLIMRITRG